MLVAAGLLLGALSAAAAERRDFAGRSAVSRQTAREAQPPKRFAPAELLWSAELPDNLGARAEASVLCSTRHLVNGRGVKGVRLACVGELAEVGPGWTVRRRRALPVVGGRSDRAGSAKLAWSGPGFADFLRAGEEYLVTVACSSPTGNRRKVADSFAVSCELVRRAPCTQGGTAVCVGATALDGDGRFRLEAEWEDPVDGSLRAARAGQTRGDRGILVFESLLSNTLAELEVVISDRCSDRSVGAFELRSQSTQTVGYRLRVSDTETGAVREYLAAAGEGREAIVDQRAFESCP